MQEKYSWDSRSEEEKQKIYITMLVNNIMAKMHELGYLPKDEKEFVEKITLLDEEYLETKPDGKIKGIGYLDLWENPFRYILEEDGLFTIYTYGPDGEKDSDDDIYFKSMMFNPEDSRPNLKETKE